MTNSLLRPETFNTVLKGLLVQDSHPGFNTDEDDCTAYLRPGDNTKTLNNPTLFIDDWAVCEGVRKIQGFGSRPHSRPIYCVLRPFGWEEHGHFLMDWSLASEHDSCMEAIGAAVAGALTSVPLEAIGGVS